MTPAIAVENLHKSFGAARALAGLSFCVAKGDIYGFLGPNGAGKTTTMRILATLLRQDKGRATVFGHNVIRDAAKVRPIIGYMPDSTGAYRDMTVNEYIEFFAAAYHVPPGARAQVVRDCIELTGLREKRDELVDGLSRGMRQRLGLARCVIHDPKVLILDEPASGLDPRARIEVQAILRTLGEMGKTIFISSHILSELRHLCKSIGIIDVGRLIFSGSIEEALERARTAHRLQIRIVDREEHAAECLNRLDEVRAAHVHENTIIVELAEGLEDYSAIATELIRQDYRILTIREEEILLEDAFLALTDTAVTNKSPLSDQRPQQESQAP